MGRTVIAIFRLSLHTALSAVSLLSVAGCNKCGLFTSCLPKPVVGPTECLSAQPSAAPAGGCAQTDQEPNDSLPMARSMPGAACDLVSVTGTHGSNDKDFFRSHGMLCDQRPPHLEVDTDGVHACLFVQCSTGSTGFGGCKDTSSGDGGMATSTVIHPSGLLGCCVSGKGGVDLSPTCDSDRHEVDAYLLVDSAPGECAAYTVEYHL